MGYILSSLIVGLVVGALARWLMPGRQAMGWIATCLLGIAGSVVGGWIGRLLGFYGRGEAAGWILSVIGALVLLWGYGQLKSR